MSKIKVTEKKKKKDFKKSTKTQKASRKKDNEEKHIKILENKNEIFKTRKGHCQEIEVILS